MSSSKIANRYAAALLELTKGQDAKRDGICEALLELAKLYEDKDIRKVLSSPVAPKELLDEVFAHGTQKLNADAYLKDLLKLLTEKRRAGLLPEIAAAFYSKLQSERGIVDATVETAVELPPADLAEVTSKLEKILGKKVKVSPRLNPDILGGFVIRIENSLLDMSLKTKLENLIKTAVS